MSQHKNISIRKATDSDFAHWMRMRKELWPEASYDELKELDHLYKAENFSCFLAKDQSMYIGFIELTLRPYVNGCDTSPVAFVEGIWVDDKWQKQGVGRLLMQQGETWARALAVKELASDTRIESAASIHAHKSWGFTETERVVYFKKNLVTRETTVTQESTIVIRDSNKEDSALIKASMEQDWGGEPLVVKERPYFPSQLPGFLAFEQEKLAGFLFYTIQGSEIEIIVFEAFNKFTGLGSKLLDKVKALAQTRGVRRICLVTHNDNLDALRFYQKRGFHICGIHLNTIEKARLLKPSITAIGDYGIPIRDEIDMELLL